MRMKIKKTLILTMLSIFILSSANSSIVKAERQEIRLAGRNRIETSIEISSFMFWAPKIRLRSNFWGFFILKLFIMIFAV